MDSLDPIVSLLNASFFDRDLISNFREVLFEEGDRAKVECDEGCYLTIFSSDKMVILAKMVYCNKSDVDFGPIRAVIAAGPFQVKDNEVEATKCFFTVYYDSNMNFVSVDVHKRYSRP